MTDQPPPGNYPPPPPGGGYPPPPPGNYPPPPPPGFRPAAAAVGQLPKQDYTSWIARVGAALIDGIPPGLVVGIAYLFAFGTGTNVCVDVESGYGVECSSTLTAAGVVVVLVAWLLALGYWIWNYGYRQGTTGSSIGKSVLKFTVVAEATGQPIGFGPSVLRQLAHIVDGAIFYIGYLFPLWDAKRQTLADKIMSTVCLPAR